MSKQEPTDAQKLEFLVGEVRKTLAILDRLDLPAYFDAVGREEPHALALLAVYDQLFPALVVLGAMPLEPRV